MRQVVKILVPRDLVLNANDRGHWRPRADKVKAVRFIGRSVARRMFPVPASTRVRVDVYVWRPRAGRYDPSNLAPTAKAWTDGWVDAGILVDDDHRHLDGPHMHHGGVDAKLRGRYRFDVVMKAIGGAP